MPGGSGLTDIVVRERPTDPGVAKVVEEQEVV
jgi:hypothetical protein